MREVDGYVVLADLGAYTRKAESVHRQIGSKGLELLNAEIRSYVEESIEVVGQEELTLTGFIKIQLADSRNNTASQERAAISNRGDDAVLVFKSAEAGHRFAEQLHAQCKAKNQERKRNQQDLWYFRVACAWGKIAIDDEGNCSSDPASWARAIVTRLCPHAKPGEFLIDDRVFEDLSEELQEKYGEKEEVSGKATDGGRYFCHRWAVIAVEQVKTVKGPMPRVRLPENFVDRPSALNSVKEKLLLESEQTLVVSAMKIANRVQEVEKFHRLLDSCHPERILLVKAPLSYGKSHLIDSFTQICINSSKDSSKIKIKIVNLDFTDSTSGIAYFISKIQQKLRADRFPQYIKEVRRFLGNQSIEMSDIEIEANQDTLEILLNVDETMRQRRLRQIELAFFQDLEGIQGTLVILIDSFEKAPDDLKKWIRATLLPEAAELLREVRIVIAGEEVPEASSEWRSCHHCCELQPITDVGVWYKYAEAQEWQVTEEMVHGLVRGTRGHPGIIAEGLVLLHQEVNP